MTALPASRRPAPVRDIAYLDPQDLTLDELEAWQVGGGGPVDADTPTARMIGMAMWAARRRAGHDETPAQVMAHTTMRDLNAYQALNPAAGDEADPTTAAPERPTSKSA